MRGFTSAHKNVGNRQMIVSNRLIIYIMMLVFQMSFPPYKRLAIRLLIY